MLPQRRNTIIVVTEADLLWNLYSSIAIGGVLLVAAPPKELKDNDTIVQRVAFILTWPMYLLIDPALEYTRNRRPRR
jgi:hypothetical protein